MRNEKKIHVWVVFSHPDHYQAYGQSPQNLRGRISKEIDLCQARLIRNFQSKPEFRLKFVYGDDVVALEPQQSDRPDVVMFLMESRNFEDGLYDPPYNEYELKGHLKICNIPYTGCDGLSLFSDYDKSLQYALALSCGLSTPFQNFIAHECSPESIVWDCYPAFVKPCLHGDSIGIRTSSVVHDRAELLAEVGRLQKLFLKEPLVVQEFLHGREYTVGIMGNWDNEECHALPIIEIDFGKSTTDLPILTHDAKNDPHSKDYMQDQYPIADLPSHLATQLARDTLTIYKHLKGYGYARADWRLDRKGIPKFLEINALPDIMDDTSSIVKMHRSATGGDHSDFLVEIIRHALLRRK